WWRWAPRGDQRAWAVWLGVDARRAGGEVEHQTVAERGGRHPLDVVGGDVRAAVEERQHLGAEDQRLPAARARAVGHVARRRLVGRREPYERGDVALDMG